MTTAKWIAPLFWLMVLYDGLLGLTFALAPGWAFETMRIPPVNHYGYVQFSAGLLLVFAAMFLRIARDPVANRAFIPYGIGLKTAYCLTVFAYWMTSGIPDIWKPFAMVDLACIVLFTMAYRATGRRGPVS